MKKDSKKPKIDENFSSELNEIIDKILEKNKYKLDKIHSEKINIDTFSLRNKKGDTLYYLKKKSNKKTDEKEILSDKIISEARENLGEGPLQHEEKTEEVEEETEKNFEIVEEPEIKKTRKRIRFGRRDQIDEVPMPTKEELLDSKEFDEIVNEIDNLVAKEKIESPPKDEDTDIVDSKLKEICKEEEEEQKAGEAKAKECAEEHDFLSDKKEEETEEIKEKEPGITSLIDFDQLKEKYQGKITIIGVDEEEKTEVKEDETKDLVETEADLLDEGIKEDAILEKIETSTKVEKSEGEQKGAPKEKRSFFKLKKPKKIKEILVAEEKYDSAKINVPIEEEQAQIKPPKLKDKKIKAKERRLPKFKMSKSLFSFKKSNEPVQEELSPEEIAQKKREEEALAQPIFRVDNIPTIESANPVQKEIIDKKINEDPSEITDLEEEANKKGEEKAVELAEEHLKSQSITRQNENAKTTVEKKETPVPPPIATLQKDSEHEHVFFDEEESPSGGWSPQINERELEKLAEEPEPKLKAKSELEPDAVKPSADVELPKEILQTKSMTLAELGFSEKEWEELDFYPLYEPFAYVEILREKESLDKCYFLVENALSEEEEKILGFIEDTMASVDIDTNELEEKNEEKYLQDKLNQVLEEYNVEIREHSKKKIFYYLGKKSLGLGKIDPLMKDPNIEDISCDGADVPVFLYHRTYGSLKSNVKFNGEDELSSFVFKLAQKCGKHISIAEPMLDATMPDGSRIQMTLSDEITAKGSTFTIRKFRDDPFSPPDMVEFNTMSSEMIAYMWMAVENGINTLFAGGTASGKTTALNALSLFIPRESKIVSIEETREINLPHPNWIPGVARSGFGEVVADKVVGEIDMYDLMKAALRQRPEYIIVGEIRGREAYVLFQAMATGHATYSTAHADSAQSLIHRLEGKPINIPRIMLQSLDIVCLHVITRVKNIRARRCKQIIEIIDIDPTTKEILTNEVFRWDPVEDRFIYSGKSYVLERVRAEKDMSREEMTTEIRNRMKIVEWMNQNNVREFRDVAKLVARYAEDPQETLKQIEKGAKTINA